MATFRDLITECIMFEHSAEHFNLVKECSELDLTCTFIADQKFMMENSPIITSGAIAFTEGYLHESYDESTLEVLVEKAAGKAKGIKEKIYNGLKKIWKGFLSFLRKITKHFDKLTVDGQHCVKKLKELTITDEDIQQIRNIVNDAKSKEDAFPVRANQPYLSKVVFGKYTSADKSVIELRNDLAAALSDTKVVADCSGVRMMVLSSEEIIDIAATIGMNAKSINFAKIEGLVTTMAKSAANNATHGMEIAVDTKMIDKQANMLQKIIDQINEAGRGFETTANATIDAGKDVVKNIVADKAETADDAQIINGRVDDLADKMKSLTSCYTKLSEAIGVSMKMYTGLNVYRTNVIGPLKTYLDNKSK